VVHCFGGGFEHRPVGGFLDASAGLGQRSSEASFGWREDVVPRDGNDHSDCRKAGDHQGPHTLAPRSEDMLDCFGNLVGL
jgi:hypothetical protein